MGEGAGIYGKPCGVPGAENQMPLVAEEQESRAISTMTTSVQGKPWQLEHNEHVFAPCVYAGYT